MLKIGINGGSTMFGRASRLMCLAIGRRHSLMTNVLPVYGKEKVTHSLPDLENDRQQSINKF